MIKFVFSGPGQYNNDEHTTFTNFTKPISTKGYIFGARTAQKQPYEFRDSAPSPTHYQNTTRPSVKPSLKPFNSSDNRFRDNGVDALPGLVVGLVLLLLLMMWSNNVDRILDRVLMNITWNEIEMWKCYIRSADELNRCRMWI